MTKHEVHHNKEAQRYEVQTPAGLAFAEYRPAGTSTMLTHTEVPEALEGQGVGSELVKAVLDDLNLQGKKVIPLCPFVAAYIGRHQEYLDLVDPAQRAALGM